jgi:glycosyltransferase involved in cell wall biosynthesis
MFSDIRPDGVFTWYELFCEFAKEKKLLKPEAVLESARTRFADTKGFAPAPEKRKEIVFAARLTPQKQPMLFVNAVRHLRDCHPQLIEGWKFRILGNGPLEDEVKNAIATYKLETILEQHPTADLRQVYAHSSCFVSTQDYENFPSLSMNEAMAAGNALVARNVGQTSLFLEDGKNGYLAGTDDAEGVANALVKFLSDPSKHAAMQAHSFRLAHETHTPANFTRQIDAFWKKVLQ